MEIFYNHRWYELTELAKMIVELEARVTHLEKEIKNANGTNNQSKP